MAMIRQVRGFEILDSRGNPTVAAEVILSDGARGSIARQYRQAREGGRHHSRKGVNVSARRQFAGCSPDRETLA